MTLVAVPADTGPTRPSGRPLVVALVGVAGAGKSSLAGALSRLDPEVRVRPRVTWWQYLAHVPALIPTFLRLHWPFRGVLVKELKRLLRLHVLRHVIAETKDCGILVFDEGPVYLLARLLVYGGPRIETEGFDECWRRAITTWAAELDAIVWLDAPEGELTARLRNRPAHPFVYTGDKSVRARLRAYREAFVQVIDELTAAGAPTPWMFSTVRGTVDQTAHQLLARLHALRKSQQAIA